MILSAITILGGCTKDRVIKIENEKQLLVVNCTFNPDSTWKLWLSSTVTLGQYSEYFPAVNNAHISLYKNGTVIDTFQQSGDGFYTVNSKPQTGNTYSIQVNASGFDEVNATDSIPMQKGILKEGTISLIPITKKAPPPWVDLLYDVLQVNLHLRDASNEINYYKINAGFYPTDPNQIPPEVISKGLVVSPSTKINTDDKRFSPLSWEQSFILFDDKAFTDSVCNLDAYVEAVSKRNGKSVIEPSFIHPSLLNPFYNGILNSSTYSPVSGTGDWKLEFYAELLTISETYYRCNKTRLLQQFNLGIPGAEFNNVYSNIIGGRGIFAAYQRHKIMLK